VEKVDTWIFLPKGEVAVFGAPGYFLTVGIQQLYQDLPHKLPGRIP
jgi:hypothetical protein